jgi:hypothetical protein
MRSRVPFKHSFEIFANRVADLGGFVESLAHELANRHRRQVRRRKLARQMERQCIHETAVIQYRRMKVAGKNGFAFRLLSRFLAEFLPNAVDGRGALHCVNPSSSPVAAGCRP